jgi:type I restriction enzyme, S subunit
VSNPILKPQRTLKPKLRFPEFSGEWEYQSLSEIASIITEKAGKEKFILMSITSGVGLVSQMEKFGREIAGQQSKNYFVIREHDFAYNKSATKEYPEGFIAMYSGRELAAVPNSIFSCFRVRGHRVVPLYLNYLFLGNLHGKWVRNFIAVGARAHGSLNVDNKDLLTLPVPLPKGDTSLDEQQKIADCLSSLEHLIAAQSQKLEALQTHKKGLMQQLFPSEGETVPKLRFPEFRGGLEWEEKTLEQVATYENGKAHENDIVEKGKYVVVNSKFISTDGEVRKHSDEAFCIADIDDILMVLSDVPNGRAIAKCYFVESNDHYTVNQRICKIKPKKEVDGKFLFYILDRNPYFLAFDDGVKQTNLRKEDVLNCPMYLPHLPEEQKKISNLVSSLDDLITAQKQKIELLKLHKKGLMQQLFPAPETVQE